MSVTCLDYQHLSLSVSLQNVLLELAVHSVNPASRGIGQQGLRCLVNVSPALKEYCAKGDLTGCLLPGLENISCIVLVLEGCTNYFQLLC